MKRHLSKFVIPALCFVSALVSCYSCSNGNSSHSQKALQEKHSDQHYDKKIMIDKQVRDTDGDEWRITGTVQVNKKGSYATDLTLTLPDGTTKQFTEQATIFGLL